MQSFVQPEYNAVSNLLWNFEQHHSNFHDPLILNSNPFNWTNSVNPGRLPIDEAPSQTSISWDFGVAPTSHSTTQNVSITVLINSPRREPPIPGLPGVTSRPDKRGPCGVCQSCRVKKIRWSASETGPSCTLSEG